MKDDTISRAAALDFIDSMNWCDEISDEAFKKITIHLENLPSTQPDIPGINVIIDTIKNAINASTGNDAYMVGLRNGMRWCWSALTDKEPEYEDMPPAQPVEDIHREKEQAYYCGYEDGAKAARSAQPGQRNARVFQGIIVEYPSISAYPEYEGKPYFSIKYTENGQEFIGYGTYKPEVLSEYLKEYFMPSAQPGWIPVTERLPRPNEEDGNGFYKAYLVQDGRWMDVARWDGKYWIAWGYSTVLLNVVAWMPLPAPYIPEGDDKHEG